MQLAYEIKIKSIIDLDKPVYLDEMSTYERLITSIRWKLSKSEATVKRNRDKQRKEAVRRKNRVAKLKKDIHLHIDERLFSEDSDYIKLIVSKRYTDVLVDAINSPSFSQYTIEMVRNKAGSFIDLPIVLKISKREVI